MSPEQVGEAFGSVDQRSDLYSLGVILYEYLAGQRPYELPPDASREVLGEAILRAVPAPLSQYNTNCDRALEKIVTQTLAKDPDARYATVEDLYWALDDY